MRVVAGGGIGRQVLPKTIVTPFRFVIQALAALALNQALSATCIGDHHHPELGIDFSFAIPIATGGTDFDFGGNDYFFLIHGELATGFVCHQSV